MDMVANQGNLAKDPDARNPGGEPGFLVLSRQPLEFESKSKLKDTG
jgi:hypothetical protein